MSLNSIKILLLQLLPSFLVVKLGQLRSVTHQPIIKIDPLISGIDELGMGKPLVRRALLILSPSAWIRAVAEAPAISMFNFTGLTFEIVRALNEEGYQVDIVDYRNPTFSQGEEHLNLHDYQLVVAHGGHCKKVLKFLPSTIPILQYVSGAHWSAFNSETGERYDSFKRRRGVRGNLSVRRSLEGIAEGDQLLIERATFLFADDFPRMVAGYGANQAKFFKTGYGAYIDKKLMVESGQRDFAVGCKNFIYVGGTGGNIQKGLDVLLEAFSQNPDLNLYIYCKVEPEIIKYCRSLLDRPNIHYIYHWSRGARGTKKLASLMPRIAFTVHAPINIGLGTAYMASLGSGLIPVGYVDLSRDDSWTVLSPTWHPEDLADTLRRASLKSVDWCQSASEKSVSVHRENWSPEAFHGRFVELIKLANRENAS